MADFEYKPVTPGYRLAFSGPVTLRNVFEDGAISVREKTATSKRIFIGTFRENVTNTKTILDLFDTKGGDTTLTIITFDPQAADPDTDEATVYFWNDTKPEPVYAGPSLLDTQIIFREA